MTYFYYNLGITITLAIASLLSIPYLYESYKDDFGTDEWRPWVKLFLFICGFFSAIFMILNVWWVKKRLLISSAAFLVLTFAWCIYYVIFGLAIASTQLCGDQSDASMIPSDMTCATMSSPETYQSFLYISSLFFMITSMTLIGEFYIKKIFGKNLKSLVVTHIKDTTGRGDSFYVHDVDETKIPPAEKPDKDNKATPLKTTTGSIIPRDTSPGPRGEAKDNSPTGRGRGRGRGRGKL